ncbi:hypothetical protein [Geomicrobium sp. JCM 19055]|uniref:hypothetical protein n=1 Tax=Geomicrobium sp. JCM 19055 TaxID=1460649 RepID=UPI00045ED1E0|nr:hypothetical protein [Geomicrobium sp. JCM 19055]GAJ99827.1 hypothetical protein JCM19055_2876 [Geomicrobium sp. JCM 19055]
MDGQKILDAIFELKNDVNKRFESLDKRFDMVDSQFGEVLNRLDRIEQAQQDEVVAFLKNVNKKINHQIDIYNELKIDTELYYNKLNDMERRLYRLERKA